MLSRSRSRQASISHSQLPIPRPIPSRARRLGDETHAPIHHLISSSKVIRMSLRKRSRINQDRPVDQTSSGDGHPARGGFDDLCVLEYQGHGEARDDEGAG